MMLALSFQTDARVTERRDVLKFYVLYNVVIPLSLLQSTPFFRSRLLAHLRNRSSSLRNTMFD